MKRYLSLLMIPALALTGCRKETINFKILCPTGAPSVAFYNYATDSNFETNNKPQNIVSQLSNPNSPYDVIVIDTYSGVKAINNQPNNFYQMAATITLGNFYLVATSEDNKELDVDDSVEFFGTQDSLPYKIFTYLYGDDNPIYFCGGGVTQAAKVLETGKDVGLNLTPDWIFLSEPYVYQALYNNKTSVAYGKDLLVINIQEEYKKKTEGLELMQASLFVKTSLKKDLVNQFLNGLKKDIENGVKDPSLIKNGIDHISDVTLATSKFGVDTMIVKQVMESNKLGLRYLKASENKKAIDKYLVNLGGEKTNAKVYFE